MWRLIWFIIGFSIFFWVIDLPNNKAYKERGLKGAVEEVWYGKAQTDAATPTTAPTEQPKSAKVEKPTTKDTQEHQGNY